MCILLPTASQSAFSVAAFSVFGWPLGGLQLALVAIGEKQPGCNLTQNCLMTLCIDLATFVAF